MRRNWYLGFLGFIGLRGVDALVRHNWPETVWLVWFVWFVYFWPLPKNGRRTKYPNISILLSVLILLVGIIIYTAPRTAVSTSASAGAWKQFGLPAYDGLHFWYPPNYDLSTRDFGNGERGHYQIVLTEAGSSTAQNGEGPTAVTLDVFQNPENYTADQWVRGTSYSNFKLSDGSLSPISMNDETGLTYQWSGLYEGRSAVLAHKNNIFMLSATYLTADDDTLQTFGNVLKTLELH